MLCSLKNIYYYGKLTPSGIFVTWQGVISIQKWKIQRPESPHSMVIYMAVYWRCLRAPRHQLCIEMYSYRGIASVVGLSGFS